MTRVVLTLALVAAVGAPAHGQFRRGFLAEAREMTLFPVEAPVTLLPSNATIEVVVKNASSAPARIVDTIQDRLTRQLTDNDRRLQIVQQKGDLVVTATVTEWTESRRSSTKYVSEKRQVGTRQVKDKNGNYRTEPIYEYGRNRPSVVITGNAGVRLEVGRRGGGPLLADETARFRVSEEHLVDENPPSRDEIEDRMIDNVIRRAAGRVTPGREPVRVLLARSDEVDRLNQLAMDRRWSDWMEALSGLKPHRDRKRDSYRLHNIAVAHEALAYEAEAAEDAINHLARAIEHINQAFLDNPEEKYIDESRQRINRSLAAYQEVSRLQQLVNTATTLASTSESGAARSARPAATSGSTGDTLTNAEIIELRAAGLDDDNLIATIKSAKAVKFDLSPAGLRALLDAKVSNRVISAMRARAK